MESVGRRTGNLPSFQNTACFNNPPSPTQNAPGYMRPVESLARGLDSRRAVAMELDSDGGCHGWPDGDVVERVRMWFCSLSPQERLQVRRAWGAGTCRLSPACGVVRLRTSSGEGRRCVCCVLGVRHSHFAPMKPAVMHVSCAVACVDGFCLRRQYLASNLAVAAPAREALDESVTPRCCALFQRPNLPGPTSCSLEVCGNLSQLLG